MNTFSILLLAALLPTLAVCGEQTSGNTTEAAASAVPSNAAEQVAKNRKEAESGNADAQFTLGEYYAFGVLGVPQDYKKAFKWVQKAAAQGNADAQNFLGGMYANGLGVPKNAAKAAEWHQKASCNEEGAAIEKERTVIIASLKALPGWPGILSDADQRVADETSKKFQEREINFEFSCVSPAAAMLLEQRFHDLNVETQMKIDANNARQQPAITIQSPPASNSIHCRSTQLFEGGAVTTDCN